MSDKPQRLNKASDRVSKKAEGEFDASLDTEVVESSQTDSDGMQEIENARTNKHSGSASGDTAGDADSITIESIDKDGNRTIVASRLTGGSEKEFVSESTGRAGSNANDAAEKMAGSIESKNFNALNLETIKGEQTLPGQNGFGQTGDDAGMEDGGSFKAISPERIDEKTFALGLRYDTTDAKLDATEVLEELGSLPFDQQVQVAGMGIQVFHQELQRQQQQIARATFEGVGEGFEAIVDDARTIVDSVGAVWQFGQDVMTNNPRALETGASAGEAIGKTLVGGVRLFQMSHKYLYDIGYTGEYARPFNDISNLAGELDRRWTELTPAEKAKLTAKFSTQFLGEAAIPLGASKIAKSEKVVVALEEMAGKASTLGGKTRAKVVDGIADVVDGLTDMVTPTEELATAGGPGIGRRKLSEFIAERRRAGDLGDAAGGTRKLAQPAGGSDLIKEAYLEDLIVPERLLDFLDNLGFNHKRRLERWKAQEAVRLKELPNPLEEGLSSREAADRAIEVMVKPWGLEEPKVKDHFELCKEALKESIPPEDIMTLYGRGGDDAFSIYYPNKISDIDFGLSRERAFDYGSTRVHHLGGVTVPDQKITCVPRVRKDERTGKWLMQKYLPETELTYEFVPEGVVRHEIGMSLMDIRGWKTEEAIKNYTNCWTKFLWKTEAVREELTHMSPESEGFTELCMKATYYTRLEPHRKLDGSGIEQVLADLYAIRYGGSCHGGNVDLVLLDNFGSVVSEF